MGEEWPESFPEKALAAPSRASDGVGVWGGNKDVIQISGRTFRAAEPGVNVPTLCAFVDREDGQRWRARSAPGRSSTAEGVARHAWDAAGETGGMEPVRGGATAVTL